MLLKIRNSATSKKLLKVSLNCKNRRGLATRGRCPLACKGGMCCTCKAKLLEGEVSMDVHWGLEDDKMKKGYILTCQSHPKTEKITVDFDVR